MSHGRVLCALFAVGAVVAIDSDSSFSVPAALGYHFGTKFLTLKNEAD
jgi:hypothetical protein